MEAAWSNEQCNSKMGGITVKGRKRLQPVNVSSLSIYVPKVITPFPVMVRICTRAVLTFSFGLLVCQRPTTTEKLAKGQHQDLLIEMLRTQVYTPLPNMAIAFTCFDKTRRSYLRGESEATYRKARCKVASLPSSPLLVSALPSTFENQKEDLLRFLD